MKYKVIISVLSIESYPYNILEDKIRNTWLTINNNLVPVFFYYGGNKNEVLEDKIKTNVIEEKRNIGLKTIKMFEILYENYDFDFLYRTNLSSYIDIDLLYEYIKNINPEKFYAGFIGTNGIVNFCSGAGYFLSKDLVKMVLDNKDLWDHNIDDDVALGKILSSLKINWTSLERFSFPSENPPKNLFNYRCKEHDVDRSYDCRNMDLLYKIKKNNQ